LPLLSPVGLFFSYPRCSSIFLLFRAIYTVIETVSLVHFYIRGLHFIQLLFFKGREPTFHPGVVIAALGPAHALDRAVLSSIWNPTIFPSRQGTSVMSVSQLAFGLPTEKSCAIRFPAFCAAVSAFVMPFGRRLRLIMRLFSLPTSSGLFSATISLALAYLFFSSADPV
jgi:hypothetical protein